MSTLINEESAATSATTERGGGVHVVKLVLGSLVLLVALVLIGTAVAGIFGLENNRDSTGYFVTHTHHYQTHAYALSTESLDVGGLAGTIESGLVRIRLTATSMDASRPLFIGIARTADADRYLATVAHEELRDVNFDPFKIDYRPLGTGAPKALPSTQTFWQTSTTGTGPQTISWKVKKGHWTAVVMNADGSRHVSVDAQLAGRFSGAWWFVAAFLTLGALALLGGIALVRSGIRKGA
jgi:hypothetical protein